MKLLNTSEEINNSSVKSESLASYLMFWLKFQRRINPPGDKNGALYIFDIKYRKKEHLEYFILFLKAKTEQNKKLSS